MKTRDREVQFLTEGQLRRIIRQELRLLREGEWETATDYDLTGSEIQDGGWEFTHRDPMSGVRFFKRLKPGLRDAGVDPKSGMPLVKGKPVAELPEIADDYDGHPGPQYEYTHTDPKSGIKFYKLKSAIRRDKQEYYP